ncbi:MAG: hypothetical protein SVN78_06160 [Deferribacterota bacterium]|nr:hypothetical protein [Deferribacterota bacterium]
MKKIILTIIIALVVIVAGIFVTFTYFPNIFIKSDKLEELESTLNKNFKSVQFDLNPESMDLSYESGFFTNTHYNISLDDVAIDINMKELKKLLPKKIDQSDIDLFDVVIRLKAKKAHLIYGPFDKYLSVSELDNVTISPINEENKKLLDAKISRVSTEKFNIGYLIKNVENNLKDAYTELLINNPQYEIKVSKLNGYIISNERKYVLILSKADFNQVTTKGIAQFLNNKTDKPFDEILVDGKEKQISGIKLEDLEVENKSDNITYNYKIKNLEFTSKFVPEESNIMVYSMKLIVDELNTKATGDRREENLYRVIDGLNAFKGKFAIKNITPELARDYMNLINYSKGGINLTTTNFQLLSRYLAALMRSIKSAKPEIILQVEPLEHKLVKATVDGKLSFTETSNIPLGKIIVKTSDLNKIQNELKEKQVLTEKVKNIIYSIKGYQTKLEDGTFFTEIEVKDEIPYIYINGQPINLNSTYSRPLEDNATK